MRFHLKTPTRLITGRTASAKEQYGALWKSSCPLERLFSRFYSRGTEGMIDTFTPKVNTKKAASVITTVAALLRFYDRQGGQA